METERPRFFLAWAVLALAIVAVLGLAVYATTVPIAS